MEILIEQINYKEVWPVRHRVMYPTLGKGYGSMLLTHLIKFAKETGGKKLWCNARVSAAGFYSKFGFVETSQFSTSNNIDFVIMELELNPSVGT